MELNHYLSGNILDPKILYYKSGAIKSITYEELHDTIPHMPGLRVIKRPHRVDGPAHIEYYESGSTKEESWYLNGKRHREDGPAHIRFKPSGLVSKKTYAYNDNINSKVKSDDEWKELMKIVICHEVMSS